MLLGNRIRKLALRIITFRHSVVFYPRNQSEVCDSPVLASLGISSLLLLISAVLDPLVRQTHYLTLHQRGLITNLSVWSEKTSLLARERTWKDVSHTVGLAMWVFLPTRNKIFLQFVRHFITPDSNAKSWLVVCSSLFGILLSITCCVVKQDVKFGHHFCICIQ